MCGDSLTPASDGSCKSSRLFRSHDWNSEIRILRPISNSQLQAWLNFKTLPLPLPGACCELVFCLGKTGVALLPFLAMYVQVREGVQVKGIGNMMVPVTIQGIFSPPGRCLQLALSLTCTFVGSSKIPLLGLVNCNSHNNRQCLSFSWLSLLPSQLQFPQPLTAEHTLAQRAALLVRISF